MAKASKAIKKKTGSTESASISTLKKEFKVKLAELSKQFDKQLQEAKNAAQAKAMKDVQESFAKQTKAKDKAVKDALSQVDKAHAAKAKPVVKKPMKVVKKEKPKNMAVKKHR